MQQFLNNIMRMVKIVTKARIPVTKIDCPNMCRWAKKAEDLGVGEICLNAIDTDGVRNGYELNITDQVARAVQVPVIASGGAGTPAHIVDLFRKTSADAALVASMVHFGDYTVPGIKKEMLAAGIPVRKKMNGEV